MRSKLARPLLLRWFIRRVDQDVSSGRLEWWNCTLFLHTLTNWCITRPCLSFWCNSERLHVEKFDVTVKNVTSLDYSWLLSTIPLIRGNCASVRALTHECICERSMSAPRKCIHNLLPFKLKNFRTILCIVPAGCVKSHQPCFWVRGKDVDL